MPLSFYIESDIYIYTYTIWLLNIAMDNHHAIKFAKPSISIRAIYTMAMLVKARG